MGLETPGHHSFFKSIGMKKIYATNFGICLVMILAFYVMMVWLPRIV